MYDIEKRGESNNNTLKLRSLSELVHVYLSIILCLAHAYSMQVIIKFTSFLKITLLNSESRFPSKNSSLI